MAILSKGTDFTTGDQVTAANLDALVDNATFTAGAVDNNTTALDSSSPQKIIVKNGGIGTTQLFTSDSTTTGVTFEKMQKVAANTVLVNDTNADGHISAKAVADTQILIGDGTGFTAAALSGDATMTNAGVVNISDDVALGGNPTTTTQSAGNNTTRVATTAFVTTAVAAAANTVTRFTHANETYLTGSGDLDSWTRAEGTDASVSSKTITIDSTGYYTGVLRANIATVSGSQADSEARPNFVNTASTGATNSVNIGVAGLFKNGDQIVFDVNAASGNSFTISLIEFILIKLT